MDRLLELLLPMIPGLQVEDYTAQMEGIRVMMQTTELATDCPVCQYPASRVHSYYQRTVADLPWAEIPVQLVLRVRRFFCDHNDCPRKIFVERLGLSIAAYARRTDRLKTRLQEIAFRLGGEAGSRTVIEWDLSASPATLIRLIRAAEVPDSPTPRVLGVDDWAKRKGQSYGTILVDLEQHRPIELLPDRTAETLAEWLKAHPGVEIISRDRAGAYAQGASEGAPEAIQVADRFHLFQNMTDTLKRFLDHQPKVLQETAKQVALQAAWLLASEPGASPEQGLTQQAAAIIEPDESPQPEPVTADDLLPSWREQRFAEVKALQQQGWSQRKIARHLGISRPTVRRYWDYQSCPQPVPGPQATSSVSPYWDYLSQRWQEGCHSRKQLYEELQQKFQYSGSYSSIRRAVRHLIDQTGQDLSSGTKAEVVTQPLSARQAAWLLISPPEKLKPEQETKRQILCEVSASAAQAYQLAQSFASMLRERKVGELEGWLEAATQSGISEFKHFVTSLRRDYQAIKAALELPWSNGQTEAQVHRLKLIKRQMYGRAKFDLLRRRVLFVT